MTPPTDPKIIAAQLCDFARANLVAEGTALDEHSPFAEVGIDSFALVELLLHCERTFGIRVPESHLTRHHLLSAATLAACLSELARHTPSPPGTTRAAASYA